MADIITCTLDRPHARKRGGPPTVTGVLGEMFNRHGFPWAAVDETLSYLRQYPDRLYDEDVRLHFRGIWDLKAVIGTVTHGVNAEWAFGREADVEAIARKALLRKDGELRKGWDDQRVAALALGAQPFVDGLEKFWDQWQPEWQAVEHVVRHPDRVNAYTGQSDGVARLADGEVYQLDFKTSSDPEPVSYPSEWRLQLAAYRWAEEIVNYDESGNEVGTQPNQLGVTAAAVVQLKADGSYHFYPLQAGRSEHTRFLQCRAAYEWLTKESNKPECLAIDPPGALAEALEASLERVG